jgi:uncharacterized Tic20 family protein
VNRESSADETQSKEVGVRLAAAGRFDTPRDRPAVLLPEERVVTALCHLSTLVPLWAVPANALLFFLFRQSSRTVCFHARQGIHYHFLFLVVAVPFLLLIPLENLLILAGISQQVAHKLPTLAFLLLGLLYGVYATFCLVGAVQALRGRGYAYPLPILLTRTRQAPVYIRVSATSPSPASRSDAEPQTATESGRDEEIKTPGAANGPTERDEAIQ